MQLFILFTDVNFYINKFIIVPMVKNLISHKMLLLALLCVPVISNAQLFNSAPGYTDYRGDIPYRIDNLNSSLALEIGGSGNQPIIPGSGANQWYKLNDCEKPTPIICNPRYTADNQWWYIYPISTNIPNSFKYKIVNVRSGYVLEVGGDSQERKQAGRQANQWYYWGGDNQHWYINQSRSSPSPAYQLINVESGYSLEIGGSGSETLNPGRMANQWYYFGQTKQQWTISLLANW